MLKCSHLIRRATRFDEYSQQCHHQHNSGANLSSPWNSPSCTSAGAPHPTPPPWPPLPRSGFPFPELHVPGIPLRVSPSSGLSTWPNILDTIRLRSSCQKFLPLLAVKCGFQRSKFLSRKSQLAAFLPAMSRMSLSPNLYRPWVLLFRVFASPQMKVRLLSFCLSLHFLVCRVRVFYFHLFMAVLGPVVGAGCVSPLCCCGARALGRPPAAEAARAFGRGAGACERRLRSGASRVLSVPSMWDLPRSGMAHASCAGRRFLHR